MRIYLTQLAYQSLSESQALNAILITITVLGLLLYNAERDLLHGILQESERKMTAFQFKTTICVFIICGALSPEYRKEVCSILGMLRECRQHVTQRCLSMDELINIFWYPEQRCTILLRSK